MSDYGLQAVLSPATASKDKIFLDGEWVSLKSGAFSTTPVWNPPAPIDDLSDVTFKYRFDASTISQTTDTTISSWADISGNGLNLGTAGATSDPKIHNNVLSAKPVIRFDGVNDRLILPHASNSARVIPTPATFFFVAKCTGGVSLRVLFDANAPSDSWSRMVFAYNRNTNIHGIHNNNGGQSMTPSSTNYFYDTPGVTNDGNFHLWCVEFDLNASVIRRDKTTLTLSTTPNILTTNPSYGLTLGSDKDGGNAFGGDIAEFMVVPYILHPTDRAFVENYLWTKWMV